MEPSVLDVHCHYLNGAFVLREIMAINWSVARGTYPLPAWCVPAEARDGGRRRPPSLLGRMRELLARFAPLVTAPERIYRDEVAGHAASSLNANPLASAPLMMDIFFMLAAETYTEGVAETALPPDEALAFLEAAGQELQEAALTALDADGERAPAPRKAVSDELEQLTGACITAARQEVAGEADTGRGGERRSKGGEARGSWGFDAHLKELLDLARPRRSRVFPFLAVDPRREGMAAFARQHVGPDGPFVGVKVYPPLGYPPDHGTLLAVYDHCRAVGAPVTVHCQPGSFADALPLTAAMKQERADLAHPRRWWDILRARPGLRVNFAHFGGFEQAQAWISEPSAADNWTATIVSLMDAHDCVYADTSAWAYPETPSLVAALAKRAGVLRKRLMFGTDYDISTVTHGNLQGTVATYLDYHAPGAQPAYLYKNAAAFLGLT